MRMRALGIAMTVAFALPKAASACYQLTQSVWMCAGESEWSAAEWDVFGDGSTLVLDDYLLNFTEQFPGYHIRDDLATPQEQFVTYGELVEADGTPPLEIHAQDALEITGGKAFRSLQRDQFDEIQTVSAVMLADISDARIMLYLDGPDTLDWATIDAASKALLNLLSATCADTTTCSAPDRAREATE